MNNYLAYTMGAAFVGFIGFIIVTFKFYKMKGMYNQILEAETIDVKSSVQRDYSQQFDFDSSFENKVQSLPQSIWHEPNDIPPKMENGHSSILILIHDKEDRYCLGWYWHASFKYSIYIKGEKETINEFIECKRWCYVEDIK